MDEIQDDRIPDLKAIAEARHIEMLMFLDDKQKAKELGMTVAEYRALETGGNEIENAHKQLTF